MYFFQLRFKTFFFFLLCLTSQTMKWLFILRRGFILRSNNDGLSAINSTIKVNCVVHFSEQT